MALLSALVVLATPALQRGPVNVVFATCMVLGVAAAATAGMRLRSAAW